MGSYLSEPITEKVSMEEINEFLKCGASSMQGWRISQEDSHNCLLDFDEKASFFAVYDGHGGHEVALYCSQHLPEFLKAMEAYKNGDIKKALEEAFLGFDATIATPDVVKILKDMANDRGDNQDSDEEEEDVTHLYEEANMPIEQVIEKYTSNSLVPRVGVLKEEAGKPSSPYLKGKTSVCGGSTSAGQSSGVSSSQSQIAFVSSSTATESHLENHENEHNKMQPSIVVDSSNDVEAKLGSSVMQVEPKPETGENEVSEVLVESSEVKPDSAKAEMDQPNNGEKPNSTTNGSPSKKGKALSKTKGVTIDTLDFNKRFPSRPKRTVQQMYAQLLGCAKAEAEAESEDSEDDDDDNDKTFEDPSVTTESSDDDADCANPILEDINSSEDDEEDDDEEDSEDEDEEPSNEDDVATAAFAKNMVEEPGSDSGCTAVVALLKDDKLYVANAGDSRCIVCRNGKAIEMSVDHKPEDQIERDRIYKAGGRVTADGRVNGGLNLSRAIGDHAYKQNKDLIDKEQMITARPDIITADIDKSKDEFMVLACDGIWNFMSSQEVVDFVRPRIKEGMKLSKICEEMFDHCLAPNTMGDGTGCDNMTAIIVQFRSASANLKRHASPEPEESEYSKRPKTETEKPTLATSTV